MRSVAGIFESYTDASQAVARLESIGIPEERISLLAPETSKRELDRAVATTDAEQPGMGPAVGGAVGGAMGAAGGMTIGAAAASLMVPGVGPVMAAGILGAALLGAGGAAAGALAGDELEEAMSEGLPHGELFVYEDALRRGRTVVIALADDDAQLDRARAALAEEGAESIDAARENWWIGLRDAEEEQYMKQGREFITDEAEFRTGFEASLHPQFRGQSYDAAKKALSSNYADKHASEAFRAGFDRGQEYHRSLREKFKA